MVVNCTTFSMCMRGCLHACQTCPCKLICLCQIHASEARHAVHAHCRALDDEAEVQNCALKTQYAWYADVEGALAKMDALQSGYQAALKKA